MKLDKALRRDSKRRKNASTNKGYIPPTSDEIRKINAEKAINRKRKEKKQWLEEMMDVLTDNENE